MTLRMKTPLVVALVLIVGVLTADVLADGTCNLAFGVSAGGGGTSTGSSLRVTGLAGQPVVSESRESPTGPGLAVASGFQNTRARINHPSGVEIPGSPLANRLNEPYPNPFNPATNIRFETAAPGPVRVKVFDARGQLVRDLVSGQYPAGRHEVLWDGRNDQGGNAPSGMYFVRFEAGRTVGTKKMTLLK
jgi:hypothetical protein